MTRLFVVVDTGVNWFGLPMSFGKIELKLTEAEVVSVAKLLVARNMPTARAPLDPAVTSTPTYIWLVDAGDG